jgi:hypothetical protein
MNSFLPREHGLLPFRGLMEIPPYWVFTIE